MKLAKRIAIGFVITWAVLCFIGYFAKKNLEREAIVEQEEQRAEKARACESIADIPLKDMKPRERKFALACIGMADPN